ncbi:hypothetical protein [Viscerimonas tarda]
MKVLKLASLSLFIVSMTLLFTSCDKGKSLLIKQTAEEVNKACPMSVDYMTTLTSCEFVPDKTLKYNYTVDTEAADLGDLTEFKEQLEIMIVAQMKQLMNQESSKALKLLDPTIVHSYKNKAGELITEITVTPEMYNSSAPVAPSTEADVEE